MAYTYKQLRDNPQLYDDAPQHIELLCQHCGEIFTRTKGEIYTAVKGRSRRTFCSLRCNGLAKTARGIQIVTCEWCQQPFTKKRSQVKHTKHNFCGCSCAASYKNAHKETGTRRSKLEVWLEEQLRTHYPDLEILFNAKTAINSELDIHFPSLNLAFELNGIYHYEPIHGADKLASIQTNDHRKFAACADKGIALCVIDVSAMVYFKPAKGQKFLDIIADIVDANCGSGES